MILILSSNQITNIEIGWNRPVIFDPQCTVYTSINVHKGS